MICPKCGSNKVKHTDNDATNTQYGLNKCWTCGFVFGPVIYECVPHIQHYEIPGISVYESDSRV